MCSIACTSIGLPSHEAHLQQWKSPASSLNFVYKLSYLPSHSLILPNNSVEDELRICFNDDFLPSSYFPLLSEFLPPLLQLLQSRGHCNCASYKKEKEKKRKNPPTTTTSCILADPPNPAFKGVLLKWAIAINLNYSFNNTYQPAVFFLGMSGTSCFLVSLVNYRDKELYSCEALSHCLYDCQWGWSPAFLVSLIPSLPCEPSSKGTCP